MEAVETPDGTTSDRTNADGGAAPAGTFEPLKVAVFRALWIAAIASNVGTWIQSVAEKWLMAELTTSPLLISLIETGTSLPMLLLALPAGALADIFDRRKLLIWSQTYMLLVAAVLSAFTFAKATTPFLLLSMSLLIGVGAALTGPAWQARVPELLSRRLIPAGVALNSAGFNVSRAIGPALGGLVVAAMGPAFAFLLNAVSFLGTVVVLVRWKRESTTQDLPGERFLGAMKVGLRYARYSRELKVILFRSVGFVLFAGIIFSLTPSLAIHSLNLSSAAFGLLLGCIGAGALLGTALLPTLRARLAPHTLLTVFTVVFAASLVVLAFVKSAIAVAAALFVCGTGWLSVLSTFNTAVQLSVPSWVRARAFGAYITCWGGGMAIGATLWGVVAEHAGLPATFAAAAAGMLAAHAVLGRMRIEALYHDLSLTPFREYPHPPEDIAPDAGPILVQLDYTISPADVPAFREAMRGIRRIRVRDGALSWSLFEDPTAEPNAPRVFSETYFSSSWGEHLLQHHRATLEDRVVLDAAYKLTPEGKPRVKHLVTAFSETGKEPKTRLFGGE